MQAMKGYGDNKKVGFGFIKCKRFVIQFIGCSPLRDR